MTTSHTARGLQHATPERRKTSFFKTSLFKAEWLQFRRNKTLLFMATVFPVGIPLLLFLIGNGGAAESANSFDYFVMYSLLFVQFYTVLSMATTRRDERVLKRLRTGEARDIDIIGAICFPGALLTLIFTVVIIPLLMVLGAPAPINLVPIVFAVLIGLLLCSALALMTSGFTRNAEAAQMTSMPVFMLAMGGLGSIRFVFGDSIVADILAYTPFAAISDLVQIGWAGATFADSVGGVEAANFAGIFQDMLMPLGILAAWTAAAVWAANRYMRWDSYR